MAAKRGRPPGRRSSKKSNRNVSLNQNYRLVERSCGAQTAFVIQRSPKAGIWFDMEGYDNEIVARQRFRGIVDGGGVEDRIIDSKVKHTRAAKLMAKAAEASETEESET